MLTWLYRISILVQRALSLLFHVTLNHPPSLLALPTELSRLLTVDLMKTTLWLGRTASTQPGYIPLDGKEALEEKC